MAPNKKSFNYLMEINEGDFGSTGFIATSILEYASVRGVGSYLFLKKNKFNFDFSKSLSCGRLYDLVNRFLCRIDASDGFHNKYATRKMLKFFDDHKPSIVHIHNVHGHFINLPILFDYCKENNIKIVWTLHDCWAITGKCPHFESANCQKWKSGCGICPILKEYPAAYLFDRTKRNILRKSELIKKYKDILTIVSPSNWLDQYVAMSLISSVPHVVINNGIPLHNKLQPVKKIIDNNVLKDTRLIFFSATYGYSKRKGIEYINRLADSLDPNKFLFIVAGLSEEDYKNCSKNILSVGMLNVNEMNYCYSIADAFINPTLEDNFPTVNLESLSNGTPVITFNTGGSPEMLNAKTGIVVEKGNYDELKQKVASFKRGEFLKSDCISQAEKYSKEIMCDKYFELFKSLISK